jgi:hypothetical protein
VCTLPQETPQKEADIAAKDKPPSRLAKLGRKVGNAAGEAAKIFNRKTKSVRKLMAPSSQSVLHRVYVPLRSL